ncbi:MAG: hypothetical protein KKF30_06065 [Proteobacteria bacterium]|nr:hypothetical protein [Desulfobacteraceae bacterium]MBU4054767.1 hypothetical protein [Pseudomonadota bacterium]MBU4316823.1 hypothetical protein [Pseudomonadota bacterium]MBU4471996.1 hypothetical protein [Pseudomonadota bacterium]MCG2753464.1 hypothetical protein [Desulfobacteraceae bacterium]
MKKNVIILSFIIAFFVSGCSWMTSFVVLNNSDLEIRIRYSLRSRGTKYWYVPPKVVESTKLGSRGPNWNVIPDANRSYDEGNGIVEITIPPKHAVLVAQNPIYLGYNKERSSEIALVRLDIISPLGQITYAGDELAKAFMKRSDQLYILRYE